MKTTLLCVCVFFLSFSNSHHPKSGDALKVVLPHKLKSSLNYKGGCGCHNYRINEIYMWSFFVKTIALRQCGNAVKVLFWFAFLGF